MLGGAVLEYFSRWEADRAGRSRRGHVAILPSIPNLKIQNFQHIQLFVF